MNEIPERSPQVQEQLEILDSTVGVVLEKVKSLEERLSNILRDDPEKSSEEKAQETLVSVATKIRANVSVLNLVIRTLEGVLDRAEN